MQDLAPLIQKAGHICGHLPKLLKSFWVLMGQGNKTLAAKQPGITGLEELGKEFRQAALEQQPGKAKILFLLLLVMCKHVKKH